MLRLKNLTNKYQKRLVRPIYANTQATPYAAVLDDQTLTGPNAGTGVTSFRDGTGTIRIPANGDTSPGATRTANAFTLKNSLIPGLIAVRTFGDKVAIASGVNPASAPVLNAYSGEQPFGLIANFIGGDLDDGFNGDSLQNQVGVWRGPDAVFEILAPAFVDAATTIGGVATNSLSASFTSAGGSGGPVLLYALPDGRLGLPSTVGNRMPVARLIDRPNSQRIVVDLLI